MYWWKIWSPKTYCLSLAWGLTHASNMKAQKVYCIYDVHSAVLSAYTVSSFNKDEVRWKFPNEVIVAVNSFQIFCSPLLHLIVLSTPSHFFLSFSPFYSPHPVCLPSPLSPSRRSYSIDKSPGSSNAASPISQRKDINRSESLRAVSNRTHRIFRPSDLIHGEVLGKGCFGQAIKVDLGI